MRIEEVLSYGIQLDGRANVVQRALEDWRASRGDGLNGLARMLFDAGAVVIVGVDDWPSYVDTVMRQDVDLLTSTGEKIAARGSNDLTQDLLEAVYDAEQRFNMFYTAQPWRLHCRRLHSLLVRENCHRFSDGVANGQHRS